MAGKVFLDSNILVYAQDKGSPEKQKKARAILTTLSKSGEGVLSTQVLQEFYVATTRKLNVAPLAAKEILRTLQVFEIVQVTPELIGEAVDCSVLNNLSFWDSLVLAAAAASGCATLYSVDLNHGQTAFGIKIQNPFR